MRRDTNQLRQNDTFGVILDTFYDRRNGFLFYTNPLGARADQAVTDEGNLNVDWNPVWDVRTGRFDGGWTVEMAIPFKSLRYRSGAGQVWGINIRRVIRRRNEWTHLTLIPASAGVPGGMFRLSRAGTLVGLDLPPASKNVELKPYGISRVTTDRLRTPALSNDPDGDIGLDAKYGVTANLTADVTVNTDFAQVEVDEQQVNLTRFNLVFPEKRDFFLEGRGIFDFARSGPMSSTTSVVPSLFYTRRIGLNGSRVIPIDVGGRLTGKVGRFGVGAMNIETGDDPDVKTPRTNFSVVRVKRDILRRSTIGAMVTNRTATSALPGVSNVALARMRRSRSSRISTSVATMRVPRPRASGTTTTVISAAFDYAGDRYGAQAQYLKVGDNFAPDVGFVRRDNMRRSFGQLRFSPRPKVRFKRYPAVHLSRQPRIHRKRRRAAGKPHRRPVTSQVERQNSDVFAVNVATDYELLLRKFDVAKNVSIPPGGYQFTNAMVSYQMGLQRRVSGTLSLQRGEFYDGTLTAYGYTAARVSIVKQWSVEPSISLNDVKLPAGNFTTTLIRTRSDYGFSPRMFVSALIQYSSSDSSFSSNLRFRWEYLPGSEMFVVYTDERDTLQRGFPDLKNRAFVIKINRLLRF